MASSSSRTSRSSWPRVARVAVRPTRSRPPPRFSALLRVSLAGVIHEDRAHGPGGDGEEVGAAVPAASRAGGDADEGLVRESGGVEGVALPFLAHVLAREAAELVVDEVGQGLRGVGAGGVVRQGLEVGRDRRGRQGPFSILAGFGRGRA